MPDIDEGSDSNTIFETCTSLLRKTLSCETCYTYSSDNNNKTLLKLIKYAQGESPQKIFDTGRPCHLTHSYAQKGAKAFSIQVDDFVVDLFYHFKRNVKKKAILRDYMEFTCTEIKKSTKLVTTRWLSLGKFLDMTLLQWDISETYFLSEFEDNDETKDNDRS